MAAARSHDQLAVASGKSAVFLQCMKVIADILAQMLVDIRDYVHIDPEFTHFALQF